MRSIFTFLILITCYTFSSCNSSEDKKGNISSCDTIEHKVVQFRYYQNDTIKARLNEIVRTDSIKEEPCYLIFKPYDKLDTLAEEMKYYKCQNNMKHGYLTRQVYNKYGKIILSELLNMEGLEIGCYTYEYNKIGLLTIEKGFGSGEIGIIKRYYYNDSGVLIDKKAFRFGIEVKDYFKTIK